ncbi:CarD family transcriptional regulator [Corynebacterium aquatimens]|uniref:CarD family transcriptional regulator n=1 Tax=Corynebacterium aquatimens TaxID=1190508 RepID=A0A931GSS0_9CORY|nr:CarD family transcriptional regulator [Corynebacterium aquatimens]MBG6122322.1 CarD family transcriptional regulator [Corynebacterium aquatimens]WJY65136.1 RNA polymerase-binding transcription factor CarD [Corynebacterium aquatimens]
MDFKVGEVVVYPHHGAARIADIEQRELKGEKLDYLVLEIIQTDLTVRVPAKNAELVGVRDVVSEDGLLKVFSVLRETDVEEAGNWSRRYKANQERLASGDINKVAEVVRDLWRRDQGRGLSAGEKRMLGKARGILVGELALAKPVDEDKAEAYEKKLAEIIARHVEQGLVAKPREDAAEEDDVDLDDLSFDDDLGEDE